MCGEQEVGKNKGPLNTYKAQQSP